MPNSDVPVLLKGMTGGVTSERTVMNVLSTSLEDTSRNIEVLRNGSFRPRRGVDFVGQSDSAAYMHTIRTGTTSSETSQESPSGVYAEFKTSDGEIVEKTIIFQDNKFKIFAHNNLRNYDSPNQTINPGSYVNTQQKFHSTQMIFADNRIFFVGKKLQPGYLYLKTDNSTLGVVYLSIHTRDLDNATAVSSRVTLNGKYYECVEDHTSASSDTSATDSFGELVFNRYWMEVDNTNIPGGASAWAASTAYTTNIVRSSNKYSALSAVNPHTVAFWKNRLWLGTDSKAYYSQVSVDVADEKTNTTPSGTHEYSLFLQTADPFDTTDPTPVPSDGGSITQDVGKLWQLLNSEDSMFLGTSSQIEEVRGASSDFTHTDFKKGRVINEGINGLDNMVLADNRVYAFANNNIWAAVDEQRVSQTALTKFAKVGGKKIKSYYIQIPKLNKGTARAVYSPTNEKIYYFHNAISTVFDASNRNTVGQNGYARSIMAVDISGTTTDLDPVEGEQFVENQIELWDYADTAEDGDTYIAYGFSTAPTDPSVNSVVVGADDIVVGADSVVVSGLSGSQEGSDEIVVIAMERVVTGSSVAVKATIGVLESANLRDWASDGTRITDYTANADMGTQTFEDITSAKAARFLLFVLKKLTDGTGSCLCRTSFNFADPDTSGESTGKTSTQTEIYYDTRTVGSGGTVSMTNYKATRYKHRVRGRGVALQVSFENTAGKDFNLLGWGELLKMRRR